MQRSAPPRSAPLSSPVLRIVVLDIRTASAVRCAARLQAAGFTCRIRRAENMEAFQTRLREGPCDLVLCADGLPESRTALDLAREEAPGLPFLFFGAGKAPSLRRRLEWVRAGATDYLSAAEWNRLPLAVEAALREARCQAACRKAERSKAVSAQKLQALLDHHEDALLLIQAVTGTVLRASRKMGTLLGYAEEDLLGRHFSVLFPPEAEAGPQELLQRLRVRGPAFEGQLFRHADGTVRPCDVTAALIGWGQTEAILTTLRDAAPRQRLERELFWNRAIAERCRDLVLWAEADGRICQANDALCRRLGYGQEEMVGLPLAEIDPGFGSDLWPIHWEEVKARGRFRLTTQLRRRDGAFVPIEAQVHHLAHDGREYQCLLAREAEDAAVAAA